MGKTLNGQQIIAHYLNDFLTTTYPTDLIVSDLLTGEDRKVCYIGIDDEDYLAEHSKFISTQGAIMRELLTFFVPSWWDTDYNWAVSLHADKCMLVIKGMDKNYSYFLTKDEAAPAINYARKAHHLVDRRFGASVDLTHPIAIKLIKNAKRRRPANSTHWDKKHAIVEEFRKLPAKHGKKGELHYLPIVGS